MELKSHHSETATATPAPRPELLAPAGDWPALRAAVANGADAVYFGLSRFNARHRAANFSLGELPKVMAYLHGHNVRGYVAFNTLIFSDELPDAVRFVRAVADAGADAVIVQDLGLARLIGRICPGLHVHGSTQMTLTEPLGVEFVKSLGVRRVILARELSTADIRRITAATDVPVEVFIHGALCVSYSGQCLTSEAIGGRSANRGQCAQACRLPYDLVVDGQTRDLGDKAYLLSPQDLAAYDLVGDLAGLGVCSLKIEGRLKGPHYVAAATQTYRAAIDAAARRQSFALPRQGELDLAQTFSRGFSHGFFDGVNHQSLVHAKFPKSRGVRVGRVVGVTRRGVRIELDGRQPDPRRPHGLVAGGELAVGDGVVFDEGRPDREEQGGRVAEVRGDAGGGRGGNRPSRPSPSGGRVIEIGFDRGVDLAAVRSGAVVWKTDDPAVRRRLEGSYARETVANRVPVAADVAARAGERLTITVRDDAGRAATVSWDKPLELAQKYPLTLVTFREQFGRMGDTPFELKDVRGIDEAAGVMVPKSVLNDLRRQAVERLSALREDRGQFRIAEPDALDRARAEIVGRFTSPSGVEDSATPGVPVLDLSPSSHEQACHPEASGSDPRDLGVGERFPIPRSLAAEPRRDDNPLKAETTSRTEANSPALHVLTRTTDQLRAVLAWRSAETGIAPASVYCDFEDIRQYKEAVELANAAGVPVTLATIRVIKPGEEGLLKQLADCRPDAILVRNLAGLGWFSIHAPGLPLVGDYALNVANELTAALFAERGVGRLVPSYDLNWKELSALLGRFPPGRFEAVIHQHMPMFHMEHCVFCHTLSTGTSYKDCGRPCDHHQVNLRDRSGAENPLVADVGCRNTVYNGVAQTAAEFVPRMKELGIFHFRVELLRETSEQASALLDRYARVLAGVEDGRQAWRQLRVLNQLGVTRGTLEG